MTATVLVHAKARLVEILAAAVPDATVSGNETVAVDSRPVVFTGDASAAVDVLTMTPGRRGRSYDWRLGLVVQGRKWHTSAVDAETEVAGVMEQIDRAVGGNPRLEVSGDAGLAGLDWCRVVGFDAPKADHGPEGDGQGGADQWTAAGVVDLELRSRS